MQPPSQIAHQLLVFSVKVMLLILNKLLFRFHLRNNKHWEPYKIVIKYY